MRHRAVVVLMFASLSVAPAPAGTAALGAGLESATLPARDGPVEMRWKATCSPAAGGYYALRVTLAQRTGRTVATGTAEAHEACLGRPQTVVLTVVPDAPGTAFRPGRVSVTSCLRVRNVVSSRAGRLASAWGADDPPCTSEPRTTTGAVTEQSPLGRLAAVDARPPRGR
jgi:hypothetical protein